MKNVKFISIIFPLLSVICLSCLHAGRVMQLKSKNDKTFETEEEVGVFSQTLQDIFENQDSQNIVFPVEVLPLPFQYLAELLPITHAVKALRELLLAQMEFQAIIPLLINLVIFILLLSPVSILFFRYAVKRAKIDGSLIQY